MRLIPEGWRWPRIVTHILDHESTTVTFGFMLFIVASLAAFIAQQITSDLWLWCVVFSTILIGGVRAGKDILAAMELRLTGKKPAEALKEDKPDASSPAA